MLRPDPAYRVLPPAEPSPSLQVSRRHELDTVRADHDVWVIRDVSRYTLLSV